ncbi:MAG: hypothetical protein WAN66_10835 [Limnoraphis robusta]|uniref:Uncharacterized protein n=2 Tax=Limnoraphis robusta TaxID=1118279 RepID=A0A0J9EX28_9CYAN|nr:hypothetical protein [Limnoraphis robusta]KMW70778.1 hypothetical protein WN50_32660 [Limnoraphis robusta CS-951]MEA5497455.1 hypothetical protein [Limnoraphis robusta BA-68 BA1]MEA5522814.1 hypothetical protein [Limnoraphis robusta CCNP1315]MEA5540556.1 hypothetical protein [Limnoraphis robusta Tam1]MEA5549004.1 hypothetical protein [Limnoraphis robusta CCNP1324]
MKETTSLDTKAFSIVEDTTGVYTWLTSGGYYGSCTEPVKARQEAIIQIFKEEIALAPERLCILRGEIPIFYNRLAEKLRAKKDCCIDRSRSYPIKIDETLTIEIAVVR